MSKLELFLQIGSCASIVLTGGVAIHNRPTEVGEVVIIEEDEGYQEVTSEEPLKVEEKPEPEEAAADSELLTATTQPAAASSTTTQPSTPATPPIPAQPTYKYSDIHDFERAYVGWCPQDVPADAYHLPLRKYATLGYIESYSNYRDFETAVLYAWTLIEGGFGGQVLYVYLQNWTTLTEYVLDVNLKSRTATWKYLGSKPQPNGPSESVRAQLDHVTAQFNTRIAQLDQQFYAKCGY